MGGMHDGHRDRMRQRLKAGGLQGFQDHEILEWMLFCTIPRGDVNPLAHQLIQKFGSLSGVLEASVDSLMTVKGVGESTALFLANYLSVYERYLHDSRKKRNNHFTCLDDIAEYFRVSFIHSTNEELHALLLGPNLHVIREEVLAVGSLRSVNADVRRLAEAGLNAKATYVVLAHNHPSGILLPSERDVSVTIQIAELLKTLEIRLLDHLIIGKEDYLSMARSKETSYIFMGGLK